MGERRTIVLMGPSGCGKSTIGRQAADRAGAQFFEGDDFHSVDAKARMAAGRPLTNQDRRPWIDRIGAAVTDADMSRSVLACSALNAEIRDWLCHALPGDVVFAWLDVPAAVLARRLAEREQHFAGPSLLASQLAALDPSGAAVFDGTKPPDILVGEVAALLRD